MASKRRVKSKKKISLLMVLFVLLAIVAGVGAVVCMMMPFYDWSSSYTFGNNTYSVGYSISGFTLAWGGSIILKGSIPAVNDYSKEVDLENQNKEMETLKKSLEEKDKKIEEILQKIGSLEKQDEIKATNENIQL